MENQSEGKIMQEVIQGIEKLSEVLEGYNCRKAFMVVDSSYPFLNVKQTINSLGVDTIFFSGFTPNPLYEQVLEGLELLKAQKCDAIIAIGGGSAIDVAKCIKLAYISKDGPAALLHSPAPKTQAVADPAGIAGTEPAEQPIAVAGIASAPTVAPAPMTAAAASAQPQASDGSIAATPALPLFAIPTTAGTGSESTHNAVVYYQGAKQTVTSDDILPNVAILEPSVLQTLPLYQKKCTLMDALCQAIESWWSVNSTPESKAYSKKAIELIMPHWQEYILNNKYLEQIMLAANYAGRAINLAQTTAAHAMSYKITSLYNLPHGHAVALCLPAIWDYMIGAAAIADPRGPQYLCETFSQIASAMAFGGTQEPATTAAAKPETPSAETTAIAAAQDPATPAAAIRQFRAILDQLGLSHPDINPTKEEIETLASSVNPIRLKNNPIYLSPKTCKELYLKILQ